MKAAATLLAVSVAVVVVSIALVAAVDTILLEDEQQAWTRSVTVVLIILVVGFLGLLSAVVAGLALLGMAIHRRATGRSA